MDSTCTNDEEIEGKESLALTGNGIRTGLGRRKGGGHLRE